MGRSICVYTGAGGYEMFEEELEKHVGLYRVYMTKVPRLARRKGVIIKRSVTGRYYRLFGRKSIAP